MLPDTLNTEKANSWSVGIAGIVQDTGTATAQNKKAFRKADGP